MRTLLLGAAALLLAAPPLHAHARLVSSSPAADARLAGSPAELRLTFSESVRAAPGGIRVVGPAGGRLEGETRSEGETLVLPLSPGGAGLYEVRWRVLAGDGHVVEGSFSFAVEAGDDPAARGASPPAPVAGDGVSPPAPGSPAPPPERPAVPWGRWLSLFGLALFAGGAALRPRVGPAHPRVGAAALLGALLLLAGAAAELLHHLMALTGSWELALRAETQRILFSSSWGQLWLLRLLAVGVALYLAVRGRERSRGRAPALLPGMVVAAVLSLGMAGASHAASLSPRGVFVTLDALHRIGAALWVGGLLVLGLLLVREGDAARTAVPGALRRFSALATWAVPVAVITGVAPVLYRFAGERPALAEPYVQLLLVKLALVAVAVAMGAYHRWRVVHASPEPGPASARVTLVGEALVAAVILLLAGSLAATSPPLR